jgi:hypothetical protein
MGDSEDAKNIIPTALIPFQNVNCCRSCKSTKGNEEKKIVGENLRIAFIA